MRNWKFLALAAVAGICLAATATPTQAQITIAFGVEPSCPYGYYDYAPYNCSPYGYYGPEWFNGGVFIGAGHWFHGPSNFHGNVDNHYDPQHGYQGTMPNRGEVATHNDHPQIKSNEVRDGRGHGDGDKR